MTDPEVARDARETRVLLRAFLSTTAVRALFPPGSEIELSLTNAAYARVAEELAKKVNRRLADTSIRAIADDIIRRVNKETNSRYSMPPEVKAAIVEYTREAVDNHIKARVADGLADLLARAKEEFDREVSRKVTAAVNTADAQIRNLVRLEFQAMLTATRAAVGA